MSAGEGRPHHLWVWFDQYGAWQTAGHGTETEMLAALGITQRARKISGRPSLTLEVAVDLPPAPDTGRGGEPDAAALIADRARAAAASALALIDPTEDPEVHAFAAATYAVATEVHAFRLAFVDAMERAQRGSRR